MQIVIGAVIFAAGAFFGVWFYAAGQQSKTDRTRQKFQDALIKNLERGSNGEK